MFLKSSKIHCVVLALFLAGASASPLCAQESGKKLALLVGIDKYPSGSGFSSLPFPQRDVDQLAGVLLASGYRPEHVRVLTLEKGSKEDTRFLPIGQNILTEFQLLAGDRRPEDSLLIALVGHGLTRKTKVKDAQGNEVEKSTGFFCPLNADIRDTRSMIALDDLYAALEQSKAGVKVMLVDACRDNPTEGNTGGIPFAPPPVPASVAALFSCSDGEVAWEDADLGGGHGVFFHYVIEGLKGAADQESGNRDNKVSLAELTAFTQDKVLGFVSHRRGRRQMPTLQGRAGLVTLLDVPRGPSTGIITNPPGMSGIPRLGDVPEPKVTGLDTITTRTVGITLKRIPAGTFQMGSSDGTGEEDEHPQHEVRITRRFYLGVAEVTQAQYEAVVGNNPSYFSAAGGGKDKVANQSTGQHPVEYVSWLDAVKFCNRLSEPEGRKPFYEINGETVQVPDWKASGYRLPTEAEWEYACGGDPADLEEHAWFDGNSGDVTHPVGKKRANRFGIHVMHGSVCEWCWDAYDKDYYKQSPLDDPTGPDADMAADRVIRGGCWSLNPRGCRSAIRPKLTPDYRSSGLGFRLALVQ